MVLAHILCEFIKKKQQHLKRQPILSFPNLTGISHILCMSHPSLDLTQLSENENMAWNIVIISIKTWIKIRDASPSYSHNTTSHTKQIRMFYLLNGTTTLQLGSTIGTSSSTLRWRVTPPQGDSAAVKNKPDSAAAYIDQCKPCY